MNFDIAAFKDAFEGVDVEAILAFYDDALEHVEIDAEAPPRAPRTSDKDAIRQAFTDISRGGLGLQLDNAVSSENRAACTITVKFTGGGSLMSNTIFDIERGKIVRQLDIQVSDPS